MQQELLEADYVRDRLDYDPDTGVFTWRVCDKMPKRWNTRYAGKVTGVKNKAYTYKNSRIGKYVKIRLDGIYYSATSVAWVIQTGMWPAFYIKHNNGDTYDNRWDNLKPCSRKPGVHAFRKRTQPTYSVTVNNSHGKTLVGAYESKKQADASYRHAASG